MAYKAKVVFAIKGTAAEEKIGNFGFFEGSYAAILVFVQSKALAPVNLITLAHNGTNYYLYYWKP